jgi:hypothetical protein
MPASDDRILSCDREGVYDVTLIQRSQFVCINPGSRRPQRPRKWVIPKASATGIEAA